MELTITVRNFRLADDVEQLGSSAMLDEVWDIKEDITKRLGEKTPGIVVDVILVNDEGLKVATV